MQQVSLKRPSLEDLNLNTGKKTRLQRLLYSHGPANGTLLLLPYDHGIEHGPIDFLGNPESANPAYLFELAIAGRFSGVVTHYGLAARYYPPFAGKIPLIVKINGKTNVPGDADAFSPLTGSVEDAVRLGADAVGYTIYVGSPAQDRDLAQATHVRQEAERLGMPLIIWAYPRGSAAEEKGGRDSLYMVDYAARIAVEMGADIVKINLPKPVKEGAQAIEEYAQLQGDRSEMTARVVRSAQRCLVLFSGGSYKTDDALLSDIEMGMRAGAVGIIAGRNMWQRPRRDALSVVEQVQSLLGKFGEAAR